MKTDIEILVENKWFEKTHQYTIGLEDLTIFINPTIKIIRVEFRDKIHYVKPGNKIIVKNNILTII